MISKLGIVEQELDESMSWLELLGEADVAHSELLRDILAEAEELLKMTVSSIKTLKARRQLLGTGIRRLPTPNSQLLIFVSRSVAMPRVARITVPRRRCRLFLPPTEFVGRTVDSPLLHRRLANDGIRM